MNRYLKRAALFGVALAASACASTGPGATPTAAQSTSDYLYVANQGGATITVIDATTFEPVRTLDLQQMGFSANAKPHHIVVEPDGSFWYVSLIGEDQVLKLSPAGDIVARVEFEVPGMMALDPTSSRLLVGRSMSAVNPPQRIGVIDRTSMDLEELGVIFPRPHALALTPGGDHAYSASLAENQFASVDLQTEALGLVSVDGPIHTFVQFAVSPDGQTLVAASQMTGLLIFYDLSNPDAPERVGEVEVGGQAWHPIFTRDGRSIVVGSKGTNTITVVDAATRTVHKVLRDERIRAPHGSAASADGRYIFITNSDMDMMATAEHAGHEMTMSSGSVAVIDTETWAVVTFIPVGVQPTGIGIRSGR